MENDSQDQDLKERQNIHKITDDMVENLFAMLISKNDRGIALNILNNRDVDDEETERNANEIFNKYAQVEMPDFFEKMEMIRIKEETKIKMIEGLAQISDILNNLSNKL